MRDKSVWLGSLSNLGFEVSYLLAVPCLAIRTTVRTGDWPNREQAIEVTRAGWGTWSGWAALVVVLKPSEDLRKHLNGNGAVQDQT
jgi:hypothetical protein